MLFYLATLSVGLAVCVCMYMWIYVGRMMPTIKKARTSVWEAAYSSYVDVMKFLVFEANVDPNKPDKVWSRTRCACIGPFCAFVCLCDMMGAPLCLVLCMHRLIVLWSV